MKLGTAFSESSQELIDQTGVASHMKRGTPATSGIQAPEADSTSALLDMLRELLADTPGGGQANALARFSKAQETKPPLAQSIGLEGRGRGSAGRTADIASRRK